MGGYKEISFQFCFSIFSDESYEVSSITETLGLIPTRAWIRDASQTMPLYRDHSCWEYKSEEIFDPIFEDAFAGYFQPLESKLDLIRELLDKHNLSCKIFILVKIHAGDSMPGIHVDWSLAARMASIKCNLDFDMYDYR